MPNVRYVLALVVSAILFGCSAIGVPETSDPNEKIRYAYMLFDAQGRPLPAERLIREAIAIYQQEKNDLGLAEAYRAYGFFFRSRAVEKWHKHYESNGFMDDSATYANRYQKSITYFDKAARIFEKHKKYDSLTNIYLNMGFTYEFAGQPKKACYEYKKSIISNHRHMKENPDATINLPKGFDSYEGYINSILKRLNCK